MNGKRSYKLKSSKNNDMNGKRSYKLKLKLLLIVDLFTLQYWCNVCKQKDDQNMFHISSWMHFKRKIATKTSHPLDHCEGVNDFFLKMNSPVLVWVYREERLEWRVWRCIEEKMWENVGHSSEYDQTSSVSW